MLPVSDLVGRSPRRLGRGDPGDEPGQPLPAPLVAPTDTHCRWGNRGWHLVASRLHPAAMGCLESEGDVGRFRAGRRATARVPAVVAVGQKGEQLRGPTSQVGSDSG